jgi:SAM-dependent methyltransferase
MNLYRNPALYDLEYENQTNDVVYYVKQAHKYGGPVLELGCGNGRITLPVARSGIEITGIDLAVAMLDDFRVKTQSEPKSIQQRITLLQGDFRTVPDCGTFPLVFLPFNALHHCQSHHDVLELFRGVRQLLDPGGRLILDCYLPDPILYQRDPNARYAEQIFHDPITQQKITSWEQSWYDTLEQVHHVTYVYHTDANGEQEIHLDLRMFYPQELHALIDLSGFRIVEQASDFRGSALANDSLKWIMHLQPS